MEKQISVTVDAPDGLPAIAWVTVSYAPETRAEFDAIVEALGGPAAMRVVGSGRSAFAAASVNGVHVHVNPPEGPDTPRVDPMHPFMAAFKETVAEAQIARERVEQMT